MAGPLLSRLFRADCGKIPQAEANRLLTENEDVVRATAHRLRPHREWCAAGMGMEDLYVIGRMAVLEAAQTYDPAAGASLRTWIARVAHWRMAYAVGKAEEVRSKELLVAAPAETQHVDDEFEDRAVCRAQLEQVAVVYAQMHPRAQHILTQHLSEVSHKELASELGICKRRSEEVLANTRAFLRDQLLDDILGPG